MTIEGLSHITFIVSDLDKTEKLLTHIFDARKVYDSGDRTFSLSKERFFLIGELWIATMEGDPLIQRTYNHIAFKVSENDLDDYMERICELGLEIRPGRSRLSDNNTPDCDHGSGSEGRSIYFYDEDNHLFELHTGTLKQRLERYAVDHALLSTGKP